MHSTLALLSALVLAFTVDAKEARADGLLLVPTGARANVTHEEVATTFTSAGTNAGAGGATWSRLALSVDAPTFVWLVPMPAGSRADYASESWFPALEAASAPRVLPPIAPSPCASPVVAETATWAVDGTEITPRDVTVISNDDALAGFAGVWNVDVSSAATLAHASFEQGNAFLALTFSADSSGVFSAARTPTIRVVGATEFPVGMNVSSTYSTVVAIGPGAASFAGSVPPLDLLALTWGTSGSNYDAMRSLALLAAGSTRYLTESANQRAMFVARVEGDIVIPSVASTYFSTDAGDCNTSAMGIADATARVSTTCVPGALGIFGNSACDDAASAIEIDAHTLRCAGDDFAVALAGASPSTTYVTRAVTYGDAPSVVEPGPLAPLPAVVQTPSYDSSCVSGETGSNNAPSSVPPPASTSTSGAVISGSSGDGPSTALDAASDASDGCSCDSDTPAADSSDASDDSCSGGDAAGDSGDACASGAGGAAGGVDDCSVAHPVRGRGHGKKSSPMSRFAMIAACSLLFLRRRMRPTDVVKL